MQFSRGIGMKERYIQKVIRVDYINLADALALESLLRFDNNAIMNYAIR